MKNFKKLETSENSLERIYVYKKIYSLWFHHNDQHTDNTIAATANFLTKAADKAVKGGYENVVVQPTYAESTEDSMEERVNWRVWLSVRDRC